MSDKAQRVVRPAQRAYNTQGLLDQVRHIFIRHRGVIGGVNALIHLAILPSVVECQRTE